MNHVETLYHLDKGLRDIIIEALTLLRPRLQPLYKDIQKGSVKVTELPKAAYVGTVLLSMIAKMKHADQESH